MSLPLRRSLPLSPLLLLPLLPAAHAQRATDGAPTQHSFGKPVAAAPTRTLGNYRSHTLQNGILTIRSPDGATLRVRFWAEGVVRVEFFSVEQAVQDISSINVVQAPIAGRAARANRVRETGAALEWQPDPATTVVIQKNCYG